MPAIMTGIRVPDPGSAGALPRSHRRPDPIQQLRHLFLLADGGEHAGLGLPLGRPRPDGRRARLRADREDPHPVLPAGGERLDAMSDSHEPGQRIDADLADVGGGPEKGFVMLGAGGNAASSDEAVRETRALADRDAVPDGRAGGSLAPRPIAARAEHAVATRRTRRAPPGEDPPLSVEDAAAAREGSSASERFERRARGNRAGGRDPRTVPRAAGSRSSPRPRRGAAARGGERGRSRPRECAASSRGDRTQTPVYSRAPGPWTPKAAMRSPSA